MSELETLFVRIETDLSAFKTGMGEARRETQDFAKEARKTFSGVGTALDLSSFCKELLSTEAAAKQSAERMKKTFAGVLMAQQEAALGAIKSLSQSRGMPSASLPASQDGKPSQSLTFPKGKGTDTFNSDSAKDGAAFAAFLVGIGALTFALPATLSILFVVGAGVGAGLLMPQLEGMFDDESSGGETIAEQIESLNEEIANLQARKDSVSSIIETMVESERLRYQGLIDEKAAERDLLIALERASKEGSAQYQDLIAAMADLCTCLRDLGTRLDSLAPLPPGGADAPGAQQMRFDGAAGGAGGGIIPASFSGASSFGGNGLDLFNEQLQATGWRAGDAAAQIADLTERAGGYRAEAGALSRILRENNVVFDDQIGVVRLLDALLPELGAGLTGVFTEAGVAGRDFDDVAAALGDTLTEAFKGAAFEGKSLRDVLRGVLDDILNLAQSSSGGGSSFLGTLLNSAVGALFGTATPSGPGPGAGPPMRGALPAPFVPPPPFGIDIRAAAKGAAFLRGATLPEAMAKGGVLHNSVVSRPTLFAMAKGYGLMGEAGPEAVTPLTRLPNGELGVRGMAGGGGAAAAGPVTITINAQGADRELLGRLIFKVEQLGADLVQVNNSIEARAVNAINYRRSRGPW